MSTTRHVPSEARTIHQFAKAVSQAATSRTAAKRALGIISLRRGLLRSILRIVAVLAIRCWIVFFSGRIVAVISLRRWIGSGWRRLLAINRRRIGRRRRSIAIDGRRVGVHDGGRIVAVCWRIVGIGCRIAITPVLAPQVANLLNRG